MALGVADSCGSIPLRGVRLTTRLPSFVACSVVLRPLFDASSTSDGCSRDFPVARDVNPKSLTKTSWLRTAFGGYQGLPLDSRWGASKLRLNLGDLAAVHGCHNDDVPIQDSMKLFLERNVLRLRRRHDLLRIPSGWRMVNNAEGGARTCFALFPLLWFGMSRMQGLWTWSWPSTS